MKAVNKLSMFLLAVVLGCASESGTVRVASVVDVNVPDSRKKVISVMKFEDRSIRTKDFNPWSMGIPEMMMETIGAIPYYKVISREYVQKQVLKEQEFQLLGLTDPASAVKLGNMLNAQYIIIGSFQVFNDRLLITAKVLSVETGQVVVQASVQGPVEEFYKQQNDLSVRLTQGMNIYLSPEAREKLMAQYEKRETKIIEASLNNYRGEQKLEEMAVYEKKGNKEKLKVAREEAREKFKKALQLDSDYQKAKKNLSKLALGAPMTL